MPMALSKIHVMEPLPRAGCPTIYLAGPVPRDPGATSWHGEAIELLDARGFAGYVVVPRPRNGVWPDDAAAQISWEELAQRRADGLLFWVPRHLWNLPGLTTNLEWGIWHASGKAVLGAPRDAPRMAYLHHWAEVGGAPTAQTLRGTVDRMLDLLRTRSSPAKGR